MGLAVLGGWAIGWLVLSIICAAVLTWLGRRKGIHDIGFGATVCTIGGLIFSTASAIGIGPAIQKANLIKASSELGTLLYVLAAQLAWPLALGLILLIMSGTLGSSPGHGKIRAVLHYLATGCMIAIPLYPATIWIFS